MQFDLGYINKVAVVHVQMNGDNHQYHCALLKKVRGEINFQKKWEKIDSPEMLVKKTGKQVPLLLHFTGKGVLNRQVKYQDNYRHTILMNASINSFYFTDYIHENEVYASVLRRDVVEEIIQSFKNLQTEVISISSGPFILTRLGEIFDNDTINLSGVNLTFENGQLQSFKKGALDRLPPVMVGEETISNPLMPCAALGAQFFFPSDEFVFPENESVFTTGLEEARQRNIFMRFGFGVMVVFLIALTANYFYLDQLYQEENENQAYLDNYGEQMTQLSNLKAEKIRKEKLLQSSGLLNKYFLSFYLMELGNDVPREIGFDQIVLRPMIDDIKPRHKLEFDDRTVFVSGHSESSHDLSQWIEDLEQEDWLAKVDILSYEYQKGEGIFELELIVF